MAYTNLLEITTDFGLYMSAKLGSVKTLNLFPSIAKNRFTWFVDNWATLYKRFKDNTGGDQAIEAALTELDRAIASYKLGSKINSFENNSQFVTFLPFITQILISELVLDPEEINYVNTEIARIQKFTATELRDMIKFLNEQIVLASSLIGKGDPDSEKLFGTKGLEKQRNATFEDMQQIENVINLKQIIEGAVFDIRQREGVSPNLLQAANRNIDPNSPVSVNTSYLSYKSVPFSISLEDMAQRYLGDKRRWYELVTINELQPPFVDETGEKFSLLVPGSQNAVTIADTKSDYVPVGQKVNIGSLRFKEETRVVERNVNNGDGTMTLYLSGNQNLVNLKVTEKAYVRIYKPHTVNSGNFILIPSDIRSPLTNVPTPNSDALRRLDKALLAFGVDFKRNTVTGDVVFDSAGNYELVAGTENVYQTIFYAIRTRLGELPFHPTTYGMKFGIGDKYLGSMDEAVLFSETLKSSLQRDPRFTKISVDSIKATGNSIAIDLTVYLLGTDLPIPLSFVG